MELKQQLVFCKQCEKKEFSTTGIVCSLSKRKPDFIDSCVNFKIDPKEARRLAARTENYDTDTSSNNSIWVYIGVGLLILRIVARLMRD